MVVIIHYGRITLFFCILLNIFIFRGQFMLGGYMIIMLILFANFYIHEYITKSNDNKRRKQKLNILRQNGITVINKDK